MGVMSSVVASASISEIWSFNENLGQKVGSYTVGWKVFLVEEVQKIFMPGM